MMSDRELAHCSRVFSALSDPARLRMMQLLNEREVCVCKLVPKLRLSQPTISYHIGLLTNAGLIDTRKSGTRVHCRARKHVMKHLAQLVNATRTDVLPVRRQAVKVRKTH